MGNHRTSIAEHAARLRALQEAVHVAFRVGPRGPEHHRAAGEFHGHYDALAFPGGLRAGMERLRRLDPEVVDIAIQFLEEDPWFFRSGYIKSEIVKRLKHAPLTVAQRDRLAAVVLRSITHGTSRDATHIARLAPVARAAGFLQCLAGLAQSADATVRERARHVLDVHASVPEVGTRPPSGG